jgi:ribosome-associated protein
MPGPLIVSPRLTIPEGELRWRFSRSSGPGGQSVNTADSRVELSFDVAGSPSLGPTYRTRALERLAGRLTDGVITVAAETERSQLRNRELARDRLAALLASATAPPPPPRRATRATKASQQRRMDRKRKHGQNKRLRQAPSDRD